MDFQSHHYIIGIDLGTTNSAVSYVDIKALSDETLKARFKIEKKNLVRIFNVPQLTGYGEFTKLQILPSFLYIPGEYDISKGSLRHPWKKREDIFTGSFARDHGSKIPSRLVSSAKSWLCNPNADRKAKILPWGSEGFEKISPVVATSEYLLHIRNAWNYFVKDEDQFLENQMVIITVPASFNEEARELTLEAVKIAGFGATVTLLEEPLAAFYHWLINHENDWQNYVELDDLILVCDVGGGTTDLSLISLKESGGSPKFERIAVGDHLILGGDNIDLSLAEIVVSKFRSKSSLTSEKWKTLCHRCREAKEKILDTSETTVRITLKGEGRSLIAGTLAADLNKDDIEGRLFEEFFPFIDPDTNLDIDYGKKINDFGLPFENEPAITKHILSFLEKHRGDVRKNLLKDPLPDFILFNGGTLKPDIIQKRIIEAIGKWFKVKESEFPQILENKVPELAVGIGASYYGLVKIGQGVKVGSGSPRSYYIGVSVKDEETLKAVCIVERGLDEGTNIDLPDIKYEVRANEPVAFHVYSSSYRSGDKPGDILAVNDSFALMAPLQTVIRFGKTGQRKTIPVTLLAEYTEMGTLSIYCHSEVSDHKWKLEFQLRDQEMRIDSIETEVYDEDLIQRVCNKIHQVFSKGSETSDGLSTITKNIEEIVGQKKNNWPLSFLRKIADSLIAIENTRKYSPEHEARWLNLTGFCMRPGFGDAFDKERAIQLWKIYLSGLSFGKFSQGRLEWWIFIRRIAAGLNAGQQRQFYQDVSASLTGSRNKARLSLQEEVELWMVAGNMERFLVKDKISLAKFLILQLKPAKKQDNLFWALSRIGARELLYGSVDRVVPEKEVVKWLNQIMGKVWHQNDPVENMVVQMARKTGDRTLDIDSESRKKVIEWLGTRNAKEGYIAIINEKTEIAASERSIQFGEQLPAGLVLYNGKLLNNN
ncbi:MAG: molecular chaperone DnaK [Desulfobacterales bacterium RIFOXYA12_FULL_46_15]|nr:MAG: molecular chaperone DnaK [Desulfobacterales bacterium RIFOXYA12_FULL_46_15]